MDLNSVISQLKSLGTAQNVKTCQRQGAGADVYGVSSADLKKLRKKLGVDHQLALELWQTGNTDARSLAAMVADPEELTPADATQWMKDVTYPPHSEDVAAVVGRSSFGISKMRQWRKQKSEYARTTGYAIVTCILKDDPDSIDERECRRILKDVETEIHRSPNRARHSMVMAVIAIGVCKSELSGEAMATGERIGHVHVDHGETAGTTPAITACIRKTLGSSNGKTVSVRG